MEESQIKFAYTSEADLLNLSLFHYTAKQWRDANPELAAKGLNPRDVASISELVPWRAIALTTATYAICLHVFSCRQNP